MRRLKKSAIRTVSGVLKLQLLLLDFPKKTGRIIRYMRYAGYTRYAALMTI